MHRFDPRSRRWLVLVTCLVMVYCAGVVVAPWLERSGFAAGSWLRLAYAPACHQQPHRCLDFGAGPLAVCARCTGLYLGGVIGLLAGALAGLRVRPPARWLLIASAPTVVDFAAAQLGLPSLANWPRFVVAIAPGLIAGLLLADAIGDIAALVGGPTETAPSDPVQ